MNHDYCMYGHGQLIFVNLSAAFLTYPYFVHIIFSFQVLTCELIAGILKRSGHRML